MGYKFHKIDQNQNEVVKRFRAYGCRVQILSMVAHGVPDLAVGIPTLGGVLRVVWVEIKDGEKSPSQRRLTPDEQKFHDDWRGAVYIVESLEEVDALVKKIRGFERRVD